MINWFKRQESKNTCRDQGIGGTVPPPDKPRARIEESNEIIGNGGPAFPQTEF
jgi:hypothetical protein